MHPPPPPPPPAGPWGITIKAHTNEHHVHKQRHSFPIRGWALPSLQKCEYLTMPWSNDSAMLCLQDFEGLTPNLLARTLETVEGGGLCIMLIKTLTSLTQLYSLVMDVHSRLRSHSHQQVTGALSCHVAYIFPFALPSKRLVPTKKGVSVDRLL